MPMAVAVPSLMLGQLPSHVAWCREEKDSCSLAAVSLSVRRKRQALLWAAHDLPADALCLVAVPDRPAALLLCPSYIMYCQQVSECVSTTSVTVNCYGLGPVSSHWLLVPSSPFLWLTTSWPSSNFVGVMHTEWSAYCRSQHPWCAWRAAAPAGVQSGCGATPHYGCTCRPPVRTQCSPRGGSQGKPWETWDPHPTPT
jgi:hypothetical protein